MEGFIKLKRRWRNSLPLHEAVEAEEGRRKDMAKRSMRRDWENQFSDMRLERARSRWTRSANSHTGPRRAKAALLRPETHQHPDRALAFFSKILLALEGPSKHIGESSGQVVGVNDPTFR